MKTSLIPLLGIIATTSLVLTTASCSERRKEADPLEKSVEVSPTPVTNPVPEKTLPPSGIAALPVAAVDTSPTATASESFIAASSTLDNITRDKAPALTTLSDTLNRTIDATISAWKSSGGTSTNMSESQFELARTSFTQKVRTLSLAGEDTWESAKTDAQSALENLRSAYGDLVTGKGKNK